MHTWGCCKNSSIHQGRKWLLPETKVCIHSNTSDSIWWLQSASGYGSSLTRRSPKSNPRSGRTSQSNAVFIAHSQKPRLQKLACWGLIIIKLCWTSLNSFLVSIEQAHRHLQWPVTGEPLWDATSRNSEEKSPRAAPVGGKHHIEKNNTAKESSHVHLTLLHTSSSEKKIPWLPVISLGRRELGWIYTSIKECIHLGFDRKNSLYRKRKSKVMVWVILTLSLC